jgi:hypothetical protein
MYQTRTWGIGVSISLAMVLFFYKRFMFFLFIFGVSPLSFFFNSWPWGMGTLVGARQITLSPAVIAFAPARSREGVARCVHPSAPATIRSRPLYLRPCPECTRPCPPISRPRGHDCVCTRGFAQGCSRMHLGQYLSPCPFDRCIVSRPCT